MLVKLELLEGQGAGMVLECDLQDHEELRIGRDPEHCRFVVPPEHRDVSRQHCSLRLVLGRLRLTTNRENPVLVGGQPAWTDSLVADGAVLRLGRKGPAVRVAYAEAAAEPTAQPTVLGDSAVEFAEPQVVLEREVRATVAVVRRQRRYVVASGGLVVGAILFGVWFAMDARASAAALESASLTVSERAALVELLKPRELKAPEDFAKVVARTRASVYCVMSQSDGRWMPHGTAWVVDRDKGLLATNAHVAAAISAGADLILRGGDMQRDIAVKSARPHPGYTAFARLLESAPMNAGGTALPSIPACDVAVLAVAAEDAASLGPSLPMAPTAATEALGVGAACASVGYPAEALQFNPEHPQSKAFQGHVIAISDFFLAPAAVDRDALLIQIDLPVAGGASGSPLIDAEGRVAGIINAGEFSLAREALTEEGRRIALPAGSTYAQRVDLLQELLSDDLHVQQERETAWAGAIHAAAGNAPLPVEQAMLAQFRRWLRKRGCHDDNVEVVSERAVKVDAGAREPLQFRVQRAGFYFVYAVAEGRQDIDLHVLMRGKVVGSDTTPDWYPAVVLEIEAGQLLQIVVSNGAAEPAAATLRIAMTEP